jgi:hypothetical protein
MAVLAAMLGTFAFMSNDAMAQRDRGRDRDEWVELGCQQVGFRADRDTIRVGRREGRFSAIRVLVRGNAVEMLDLKVVYASGDPDDIQVRSVIRPGDRTRPLDLRGWERAIDRVEMVYRAVPNFRGRATVCVEGRQGPPRGGPGPGPGPGARWEELGCQQVSFIGKDRDVIRVGRREGRFKAIRLHARGNDVEVLDLKVIYTNGDPDDIQVRQKLRAGQYTRPLDLRGWQRAIDRVELVYRSRPSFRGLATVCVEGLQ